MKSTEGQLTAARNHLKMFKHERAQDDRRREMSDRYWVELTYSYGLTADDIAEHSGLPLKHVNDILRGA